MFLIYFLILIFWYVCLWVLSWKKGERWEYSKAKKEEILGEMEILGEGTRA